jgi:hypothetical protein
MTKTTIAAWGRGRGVKVKAARHGRIAGRWTTA